MGLSGSLASKEPDDLADPTDRLALAPVARRRAAEEVRAQLLAVIESGQLKVDDRLPSEAELARRFGVSRPIVREALGTLQALGLTVSHPGRGTFVNSTLARTLCFDQYSASDLNEIRRCLEVPAAQLAAERRTPGHVTELSRILDEHDSAVDASDAVRFDGLFHLTIAKATGNRLFARLIGEIREILQEQSLAISTIRDSGARAAREHRRVLDAIAASDSVEAGAAMDAHLDAVQVAIEQLSRRGGVDPASGGRTIE